MSTCMTHQGRDICARHPLPTCIFERRSFAFEQLEAAALIRLTCEFVNMLYGCWPAPELISWWRTVQQRCVLPD